MRKGAHQWQRATTAKSGSLDVNKVHSYKYILGCKLEFYENFEFKIISFDEFLFSTSL